MYQWNAEDYARHSQGQERWARELLADVQFNHDDDVLDVGCGDGRITAAIAAQVPQGRVVGTDLSPDMVMHAQKYFADRANLSFRQMDAAALQFENEFSVVFSNAALHWVRNHQPVLAGISRALKPNGRFVAQMGGAGNGAALIAVFDRVGAEPDWRRYFVGFESTYGFHHPRDYVMWLQSAGLCAEQCQLIVKDMLHADVDAFVGWIRSAWHPYTAPVPLELREQFIHEVAAQYLDAYPLDAEGRAHVRMVRLQVRATKLDEDARGWQR